MYMTLNIMKCQIYGAGLVKCLSCKHEEPNSLPINHFFFNKSGLDGMLFVIPGLGRQETGRCLEYHGQPTLLYEF